MRTELDARIQELARALFRAAREVLAVGASLELEGCSVLHVDEPSHAVDARRSFDAALWLLAGAAQGSPCWGLSALRPLLRAEAPVLLAAPARAPAWAQLRALLARERALPRPSLEALCDAVLLQGLCAPRVHAEVPGWFLVSATLPQRPSALDAFFEQPGSRLHR